MEPVPCLNCNLFFIPRNCNQTFCSTPVCQRARKNLWQKNKLATDPDYKKGQQLAQNKWLQDNPNYWKKYRERNPEKAQRNRDLQKVRNLKGKGVVEPLRISESVGIAKMDASKARKYRLSGEYWMVPTVAKMDPVKVYLSVLVPDSP